MYSPYKGKFKVTQEFKGYLHDGLDLVGIDSKDIYSTVSGTVERAGWENIKDKKQGFGQYVRIKDKLSENRYYFGHLSEIFVNVGQSVNAGEIIGAEGNTGYSFGSHCHYCIRGNASKSEIKNVSEISGIPNKIAIYEDKSTNTIYIVKKSWKNVAVKTTPYISQARITARRYRYVIYDQNGKTVYSYR